MNEGPFTDELDLGSAQSREDLADLLRKLHILADRPSFRQLSKWSIDNGRAALAKSTVSEMLNGQRWPSRAVMLAFVEACGVPAEQLGAWQRVWSRVAIAENDRPSVRTELAQLRQQIKNQARQEAATVVVHAQQQAEDIIASAERRAANLLAQARGEASPSVIRRATGHIALDDPGTIARLLEALIRAEDDDQVWMLLSRNPASQVTLNNPAEVARLIEALAWAGAHDQLQALLARDPASQVTLDDVAGVARLIEALAWAGAHDQLQALLARDVASQIPLEDAQAVAQLIEALKLKQVPGNDQLRVLLNRDPASQVTWGAGIDELEKALRRGRDKVDDDLALLEHAALMRLQRRQPPHTLAEFTFTELEEPAGSPSGRRRRSGRR